MSDKSKIENKMYLTVISFFFFLGNQGIDND